MDGSFPPENFVSSFSTSDHGHNLLFHHQQCRSAATHLTLTFMAYLLIWFQKPLVNSLRISHLATQTTQTRAVAGGKQMKENSVNEFVTTTKCVIDHPEIVLF